MKLKNLNNKLILQFFCSGEVEPRKKLIKNSTATTTNMGYKCPECKKKIDHLKYSQSVNEYRTEYGTYSLPENPEENDIYDGEFDCEDSETNDSESGDDTEYRCPFCDSLIRLSDLEKKDDEDEEEEEEKNLTETEEEKEEKRAKVIMASSKFEAEMRRGFDTDVEYRICGICGYLILAEEEDEEIMCPECENIITKKIACERNLQISR